ncbi:MAG: outer membrane beta-barrel protein [Bacteroidota bacterium]|nr:outer membrane beta-barrel protein [Bacteroidota bacterium]
MYKKIALAIVLIICLSMVYGQDTNNPHKRIDYGVQMGVGITNLVHEDSLSDGASLMYAGGHMRYHLNSNLGIYGALQYSVRGANTDNMVYKCRLRYVDLDLMPEFTFFDYFTLRAGFRYAVLASSVYKELRFHYHTYDWNTGYDNQLEAVIGMEAEFSDQWAMYANYTLPVNDLPYSNLQVGIYFRPGLSHEKANELKMNKIPSEANQISKVTDLNLQNDDRLIFPPEVFRMYRLKKLNMSRNYLRRIPSQIARLKNLEYLTVLFNDIEYISDSIKALKNLEYLDLRYNELTSLPESMGELESLEILFLGHNNLKRLPESIGVLKNLKYLQVGKNYLDGLPESLFEINSLVELDLRDCGIMSIPDKLDQLRNLERLYIDCPVPPSVINSNPRLKINPPEKAIGEL